MDRRVIEREVRKKWIMQAAAKLFNQKNYYNTTIEEIAQVAELGKGTIYNFFVSKEDLLVQIYFQELELLNAWMIENLQEWSVPIFKKLAKKLFVFHRQTGMLVFPLHEIMLKSQKRQEQVKVSLALFMNTAQYKQQLLCDFFDLGKRQKQISNNYASVMLSLLFDQKIYALAYAQEHTPIYQIQDNTVAKADDFARDETGDYTTDIVVESFLYGIANAKGAE